MKINPANIFCTLFDSNYLDKGLALYESLKMHAESFQLFIFAFDEVTFRILNEMKLENVWVIKEQDFMFDELENVKKIRKRSEYCWTCTPIIIEYALEHYNLHACTYIDADMFFYTDPAILFEEIEEDSCSVSIIEHRFIKHIEYAQSEKLHGKYCVEFNTFYNDEYGRKVLRRWKEQCMECCSSTGENGWFGDQKYLDDWTADFEKVHVLQHVGAGVAPWNITRYYYVKSEAGNIILQEKGSDKNVELIFYHFHNLKFESEKIVKLGIYNRPGRVDDALVKVVYTPYFEAICRIRKMLEREYAIHFSYESERDTVKSKVDSQQRKRRIIDVLIAILAVGRDLCTKKKDIYFINIDK